MGLFSHVGAIVRDPVPVPLLASHVERMSMNENCGFVEEYKVHQLYTPVLCISICSLDHSRRLT